MNARTSDRPLLVLASASPRRSALLEQAGFKPDRIVAPEIDETPRPRELPRAYARRMARAKAEAAARTAGDNFVLAADTVVACGRRILPKPAKADEVRACLRLLSGRRHRVTTAVALVLPGGACRERIVDTHVTFKSLSPQDIEAYAACGEGVGKAGGYAIQERAGVFVRYLGGSYTNVVGLPIYETAMLLEGCGLTRP